VDGFQDAPAAGRRELEYVAEHVVNPAQVLGGGSITIVRMPAPARVASRTRWASSV
jgi:hypothetical protein